MDSQAPRDAKLEENSAPPRAQSDVDCQSDLPEARNKISAVCCQGERTAQGKGRGAERLVKMRQFSGGGCRRRRSRRRRRRRSRERSAAHLLVHVLSDTSQRASPSLRDERVQPGQKEREVACKKNEEADSLSNFLASIERRRRSSMMLSLLARLLAPSSLHHPRAGSECDSRDTYGSSSLSDRSKRTRKRRGRDRRGGGTDS